MSRPKILIIEDDKIQAELIARMIASIGRYELILAHSAKEGFEALRKNKPLIRSNPIKLILLDIKMPEMDGLQFLEKMREQYGDDEIGAILLTAYEDTDKWDRAILNHISGYLKKPVGQEQLADAINQFFAGEKYRNHMKLETFQRGIAARKEQP